MSIARRLKTLQRLRNRIEHLVDKIQYREGGDIRRNASCPAVCPQLHLLKVISL